MTWQGVIGTRHEGQRWLRTCIMTLTSMEHLESQMTHSVVIWRWFGQDKDVGANMTRRWWHDNRQANLMTEMAIGMIILVEKDVEIEFKP